ncbi:MAG TPA: hypothetical protein VNW47_08780 [Terriglobales bacterium]|jgi:hypothetical protein|nr:hypothetical protein [Terriglobales bacterium]
MAVTGVQKAERTLYLSHVAKIENSHTLHGSESLRKLLRYLAEHALDHPGVPVKEYQIATEVFGRPAGFDPQVDSTIRVQAGRLRLKLAEYYASEGTDDAVQIEMPKGTYLVSFHPRTAESSKIHLEAVRESGAEELDANSSRRWWIAVVCLSVLLAAALAVIGWLVASGRKAGVVPTVNGEVVPAEFVTFWKPFVSAPEEPWVIFSNAKFVGRPETGMRYFVGGKDAVAPIILDHYTGVGEVLAVHNLDRVFNLLHRQIRLKRGSLFSLDDAKNNELIFVGSPAENLTLRDIPGTREFVFQYLTSGPRAGDLSVGNIHPQAGEQGYYIGTPATSPLSEDYGVIALEKGLDPEHWVLILAGTTTIGTQAAVEFACDQSSLHELLQRIGASDARGVKPFEALLRVKVARGVPVQSSIVAVRTAR